MYGHPGPHLMFDRNHNWRLEIIDRAQQKGALTQTGMYLALVALGCDEKQLQESMRQLTEFQKSDLGAEVTLLVERKNALVTTIAALQRDRDNLSIEVQNKRRYLSMTIEDLAETLVVNLAGTQSAKRKREVIEAFIRDTLKVENEPIKPEGA